MRSYLSAIISVFMATQAVQAADGVGTREISIPSTARGKSLAVTLWYPSAGGGQTVTLGDNRVFQGTSAEKDATIQSGPLPLVLLSHGSGSRSIGMAWIAAALAENGYLVAAPDHPGTTSGDSTPQDTPKIWERTDDISTVITALTTDATWSQSIDPARIGILGFSLGGSTAMELAGARASLDSYVQYCIDHASSMDCQWFAGGRGYMDDKRVDVPKLDLRTVDKARFEQSNHDARIRTAVLVDPGLEVAFTKESLEEIDIPLSFINLGSVGKIPVSVLSDQLAKDVPGSSYVQVDDADHFSFLPECKEGAAEFLKSVGEIDPICVPTARERADIHTELKHIIVDAFQRTLKATQSE